MAYLGSWKIDDLLTWYVNTHTPSTSGVVDADAVPGYRIYEDETGTPLLTGSMALLDDANTTGFYSEQITLSAANGFEKGKCYCIRTTGVVASVTAAHLDNFQIEAEVDSNSVSNLNASVVTASSIASGAITSAKFAAGAIDSTAIAADAIGASQIAASAIGSSELAAGAITSAKFASGAIDATAIASGAITSAKFASGAIDATAIASSAITSAKFATGAIDAAAIAADAIGASELAADAVAEIADGVWDEVASGHLTSGTFGQRLNLTRANTAQAGAATTITLDASASATDDFYNGQLLWISGGTGAGQARVIDDYVGATKVATVSTWATNPDNTSVFVIIPFGVSGTLSAGGIADAVWDELRSGHITSGTYGEGDLQVYGSVGIESSGRLNIQAWLEDSGGAVANATACTMEVCDLDGTTCIANVDWSTAPTENSDNTWYAIKTGGSGSLSPGMVYRVKVTMTYNSISYVRFFAFNAAL